MSTQTSLYLPLGFYLISTLFYLSYLAGKLPEESRRKNLSEDAVKAAFLAFRKPQKK